MAPITTSSVPQFTERQPLRRATYVHVSDLISAYNIDHVQLEREIARVNLKRSKHRKSDADAATRTTTSGELITEKVDHAATSGVPYENTKNDGINCNSDEILSPDEDSDPEGPIVPQKRLQPPRGGFNLCVLVGEINLVVDKRRVDQSRVRLAEVEIGDETGTVSFRARDEQIDLLEKIRSKEKPRAVVLRNCTLELYQGKHIRLAVTKWGKLTEYPDNVASTPGPPPTMNTDRNFSFIDLSLVASEIADKNQPDSLPYASATTSTSASRQSKKADAKANRSTSSSTKTSSTPNKQGQSSSKHQQTSKRNSRSSTNEQRRQSRTAQYGGVKVDTIQASRSNQIIYHGIQGYHGYSDQRIDMHLRQQYPPHAAYAHTHIHSQSSRQQDAASAQFALQQQYEMQQRQLHQLYTTEQNRQIGQVHQQQPPQMLVRHMSNFDASIGSYTGEMSMSPEVGNSPNLGPPSDHHSQSPKIENHPRLQEGHQTAAGHATMGTMSPYRIGKMNPEASSFAPSYLSAAQGSNTQQQMTAIPCPPQYPPYNISQQHQQQQSHPGPSIYPAHQSPHHPPFYMSAAISPGTYHNVLSQQSHDTSLAEDADRNTKSTAAVTATGRDHSHYNYANNPAPRDLSPSSGKDNVTSKP